MRALTLPAAAILILSPLLALAQDAPNLVANPGFETLDADGWPEGWKTGLKSVSLSTENPRSGKYCLKWQNDDPGRYDLCSIPVKPAPGKRYEIEAWVRTQGLGGSGGGATICLESWGEGSTFLGGTYPGGLRGDTPEWTRVHGITGRIPEKATSTNLLCYVRQGGVGTAWFDDVSVRLYQGPLVEGIATNLYRGRAVKGTVKVRVGLNFEDYDLPAGAANVDLAILDATGDALAEIAPVSCDRTSATFEFAAETLPEGTYELVGRASVPDRDLSGEASLKITRTAQTPPAKAYIDEHHRLIVDGEPFFPLGTYWNVVSGDKTSMTPEKLDIYAESAFNCLMPYDSTNVGTQQLDLAQERGLKVIYSVKDFFVGKHGLKTEEDERRKIAEYVNRLKDHPAIIAWYTNDELPASMYPSLRRHQEWMEELDPGRPTWIVLYQVDDVGKYLGTFDVIGTDPYPIPGSPAGRALVFTRKTVEGTLGLKPVWMVPQIFNWSAYRAREDTSKVMRGPSLTEMRSMAWQCICAGANGLIFYSWMDLWRMERLGEPFDSKWPVVQRLAAEIAEYIPVLLSVDEPVRPVEIKAPEEVAWRLYAKDGKTYLCTVNSSDEALEADFVFPKAFAEITVPLGLDTIDVEGNRLHVRFGGLEPKIICLTP